MEDWVRPLVDKTRREDMEEELYPAHFICQTEVGPKRQWRGCAAAMAIGGEISRKFAK